eukprot:13618868-Heterocapsa_arctica.AAC.1
MVGERDGIARKIYNIHVYGKEGCREAREGGKPTGHAMMRASREGVWRRLTVCLLYTSDAADE